MRAMDEHGTNGAPIPVKKRALKRVKWPGPELSSGVVGSFVNGRKAPAPPWNIVMNCR